MVWALVLRCVKTHHYLFFLRRWLWGKTTPLRFPHDFMAAYVLIFHLSKTFPGELHFNYITSPEKRAHHSLVITVVILLVKYDNWPQKSKQKHILTPIVYRHIPHLTISTWTLAVHPPPAGSCCPLRPLLGPQSNAFAPAFAASKASCAKGRPPGSFRKKVIPGRCGRQELLNQLTYGVNICFLHLQYII